MLTAGKTIIARVQAQTHSKEIKHMNNCTDKSANAPKASSLIKLSPVYEDGLLKVGGRLQYMDATEVTKHPVILAGKILVIGLIIRHLHEQNGNIGGQRLLAIIQQF